MTSRGRVGHFLGTATACGFHIEEHAERHELGHGLVVDSLNFYPRADHIVRELPLGERVLTLTWDFCPNTGRRFEPRGAPRLITSPRFFLIAVFGFSKVLKHDPRVPNYETSRDARCVKVAFLGVPRHPVAIDSLDVTLTVALGPRAPTL